MEESLFKNQGSITNFDEVLGMLSTYISKKEDIDFITRAFNYANEKHAGQVRKSGEPYINHCLSVAYILEASEDEEIRIKEDENSGVKWINIDEVNLKKKIALPT